MTVQRFASYLKKLEKTTSRNEITVILAELFGKVSPDEARIVSYLTLGRLAPKFERLEFQMATKSMLKVLALTYGKDENDVKKAFKEKGDLGIVAETLANAKLKTQDTRLHVKNREVVYVYNALLQIARYEGAGSVERKVKGFSQLLKSLDPLSVKYIVRIPVGALRLGFSDMTILDALSWKQSGDKSLRKKIEHAFNVSADIGRIAEEFCKSGIDGIKHLTVTPGIPIRPQQAERLPSSEAILDKLKTAVVEYKLDGFRAQVHVVNVKNQKSKKSKKQLFLGQKDHGKEVMIFSRSLESTTQMFPEIVDEFEKLSVSSVILDGEAIGYDPQTNRHLPFQETIQRKRKHGIGEIAKTIPLRYYAFDILYLDGKSLLNMPFSKRRKLLEKLIKSNKKNINPKTITIAEQKFVEKPRELTFLFNESVKKGYEGIMAKKQDEPYQAGARNYTWVKFKHMGQGKIADTLDCVVMGTYRGQGKRSKFGIGAFLVGVRQEPINQMINKTNDQFDKEYVTIAKIGTGLSDKQWIKMHELCTRHFSPSIPIQYDAPKNLEPDAWVSPSIVVEVAADEITKTPIHTAGLALRFPRLISFRDDKRPEDATTVKELKKLFKMQ